MFNMQFSRYRLLGIRTILIAAGVLAMAIIPYLLFAYGMSKDEPTHYQTESSSESQLQGILLYRLILKPASSQAQVKFTKADIWVESPSPGSRLSLEMPPVHIFRYMGHEPTSALPQVAWLRLRSTTGSEFLIDFRLSISESKLYVSKPIPADCTPIHFDLSDYDGQDIEKYNCIRIEPSP